MSKSRASRSVAAGNGSVPRAVVGRLSLYLRQLETFLGEGRRTTSSSDIGRALGITDAQVRKDLAYFGQFGHPGIGYRTGELTAAIRRILGTDQEWPVALVGVGNLGRALLGYRGFRKRGFHIRLLFDIDPQKVGQTVEGLRIEHMDALPTLAAQHKIRVAIVAVPAAAAQEAVSQLAQAGVEGILNFAPVTLGLSEQMKVISVDLAVQLEHLSFLMINAGSDQQSAVS